jgi:photosystem II stability/assembly factor-like uncharacterized protein
LKTSIEQEGVIMVFPNPIKNKFLWITLFLFAATNALCQSVWTQQNSGPGSNLYSVIWTGTLLVAVGDGSTILTSPDGITWTKKQTSATGASTTLRSIVWTGEKYLAVGSSWAGILYYTGKILTSTVGIQWDTIITNPSFTSYLMNSIIWTGKKFVAAGWKYTSFPGITGIMLSSNEGINWTEKIFGSLSSSDTTIREMYSVAWTGRRLVAAGAAWTIVTSDDSGSTWVIKKYIDYGGVFRSIVWNGTKLVAVGDGCAIGTSQDNGDTWQWATSFIGDRWGPNPNYPNLSSVIWTGSQFVAVGDDGAVFASQDGYVWTVKPRSPVSFLSIAFTGTQFVAVGGGGAIYTSPLDSDPVTSLHKNVNTYSPFCLKISGSIATVFLPAYFHNSAVDISVFSLSGKKVMSFASLNIVDRISFSTHSLASGVYRLVCGYNGGKLTRIFSVYR